MIKTDLIQAPHRKIHKHDLDICGKALKQGGVVIFPTDTVYGMACNAFHTEAIRRIYTMKGRTYRKPLPILLPDQSQLHLVAQEIPKEAVVLMEKFWPGPLTLVFKTAPMAVHAARGRPTIAVRVPDHGVVKLILEAAQVPLATTSANKSGQPSLISGSDAVQEFTGKVDLIVDGGDCPIGKESTVVDVSHYPFTVLRIGAISKATLIDVLKL